MTATHAVRSFAPSRQVLTSICRWLSARPAVWAAFLYAGAAMALFGAPLIHGGNDCVCLGTDESIPTWALEWFPYAVAHGLNPFYSHLIYVSQGFDVALATVMPGASVLLAPVTFTAGPLAAYNVGVIFSPALAAFFAFLLCRRITKRFWPAIVGGWLFGFSSYMLGQMVGHLFLSMVFLLPAIVHLVLRRISGELSRRTFVALMVVCLVLQMSFSTEVLASLTLFGAVALVVAFGFAEPRTRSRLWDLLGSLGLAYAITALLAAPYLYYALQAGGLPILPARDDTFSNALLSFAVPSKLMALGGAQLGSTSRQFTAGAVEGGAYLGLPLLVMAVLAVRRGWALLQTRVLACTALIVAVCSLGGYLQLTRSTGIPMPWWPATHLPVLGLMIPARFAVFTSLAVALLAAWWLSVSRHQMVAWTLAGLSVAFLWPAAGRGYWTDRVPLPALFTSPRYRDVIGPHDIPLLLPVGPRGYSMLWQAETGLRFAMASGYLPPPESPNPYKDDPIYPALSLGLPVASVHNAARDFLIRHHVSVAVIDPQLPAARPWLGILHGLGWRAARIGGAIVLRRPRSPWSADVGRGRGYPAPGRGPP